VKRIALITLILGSALAVAPAASAVVLSDGSSGSNSGAVVLHADVLGGDGILAQSSVPAGLTKAEYRALMIRSAELNALYGNHITDLSPQQFKAAYEAGIARSYGPSAVGHVRGTEPSGSTGSTFDWGYFSIAVAGAMLLALATLAVTRRRQPLSF
jgi:hypothetical protein